jgi:ATP-dependent DNA helicase PIF1
MLDGDLFDKLAHIATRFRRKPDKPFGGIQLIMTGDFFQLPPVTKGSVPRFAFEAKSWEDCIDMTVNLTKVFRQRDTGECDGVKRLRRKERLITLAEFIDMLNEMRFGRLSDASIGKFRKLKRQPQYNDGIEPTELCVINLPLR